MDSFGIAHQLFSPIAHPISQLSPLLTVPLATDYDADVDVDVATLC